MGRLAMFLEGFKEGTLIKLLDKDSVVLFDGVKEDIPHRYEDKVNIVLGSVTVENGIIVIMINYSEQENY